METCLGLDVSWSTNGASRFTLGVGEGQSLWFSRGGPHIRLEELGARAGAAVVDKLC